MRITGRQFNMHTEETNMTNLSPMAIKTLLLSAERPGDPTVQPLGLPDDYFELLKTPNGTAFGWHLTEIGKAAQKQVVKDRIAMMQTVAKAL